jgi:CpeT/CpcT family (DUF1001)
VTLKPEKLGGKIFEDWEFMKSLSPPGPAEYMGYQIDLGFEAAAEEFLSYDKGISPTTGKAMWGELMEPFRFVKRQDFASEILVSRKEEERKKNE